MAHILAVDDEPDILGTVSRVLKHQKHDVTLLGSGKEALEYLQQTVPDLLILDIMMPKMDGLEVCRRVRQDLKLVELPILFLTAKDTTDDIVEGLDAGANDYVVKPFELAELQARIRVLLRGKGSSTTVQSSVLKVEDLSLDSDSYQAYVLGKAIQLTITEYRLLSELMTNVNKAQTLSHLLQAVWEYPEGTGDADLVRTHIRNLRNKIEIDPVRTYIQTVFGVGYMVAPKLIVKSD